MAIVASLAVKQLHAEELLELEKLEVEDKDINLNILRKEKLAVEKTLGTKCMAKEGLLRQVHSLKERAAKQKSSDIDPMQMQ